MKATKSPLIHVKVQPLQDLNFLATAAVGLIQAPHLNEAVGSSAAIDSNHGCSLLFSILTFISLIATV